MTTYATYSELVARLSKTYQDVVFPEDDSAVVLQKASEVIDEATLYRAQPAYDTDDAGVLLALSQAVCDQVEFWLEVGEEHDVTGLRGSLVSGRVQVHPVAGTLAPRAKRTLMQAGLYSSAVNVFH